MLVSLCRSNKSISDNFVRLNMKQKRFCRKYNRMTGSQYKRQQWKRRQNFKRKAEEKGERSGCFICGKFGHWARNCTEKKTLVLENEDNKTPEEEDMLATESPYPSVEEMTQSYTSTDSDKNVPPDDSQCSVSLVEPLLTSYNDTTAIDGTKTII